jgi:dethiobiotin synthetase
VSHAGLTKTVFITGTDTGVGKTLLTALLLSYLRSRGARALALKPFCSGGRADAQLLRELQNGDLALEEVNPFYFPEPIAPLISARKHRSAIPLNRVVHHVQAMASRVPGLANNKQARSITKNSQLKANNYLLIEGSGGLLVPLGQDYTVRDLIFRLDCEILVVARNRLGTMNHTLLTLEALHSAPAGASRSIKVLLMDSAKPDHSSESNPAILRELLAPTPVIRLPFLGPRSSSLAAVSRHAANHAKILTEVLR